MDFDHVFDEMDINADPFALCELRGRCDLGLGRQSVATLHYFLSGRGEVRLHNHAPIRVSEGTLVLVPANRSHLLRSLGEGGRPLPICCPAELELDRHIKDGPGEGRDNTLLAVCGHVRLGLRGSYGIIDLLREPLFQRIGRNDPMMAVIEMFLHELSVPTLGSRAMVRTLLLQCVIHLMRRRLEQADPALDWMKALVDRKLWVALRQMLDKPGDPHSVESLAETAGLSRSIFAERFTAVCGSGPMNLLRRLRMNHAASLLATSDLPVKRIAAIVGFRSRSAFSRCFEAQHGMSPRAFRMDGRV